MKTVKIYMVRKPSDINEVMELCRRYAEQAEEVVIAETVNLPPVITHTGFPCKSGLSFRSQETKKQSQSTNAITCWRILPL